MQIDQDDNPRIQESESLMIDNACMAANNSTPSTDASPVNEVEHGLVPLMEYRHPELISLEIQVGFYLSWYPVANGITRNTFGLSVRTSEGNG
jgi:hypothetical protein